MRLVKPDAEGELLAASDGTRTELWRLCLLLLTAACTEQPDVAQEPPPSVDVDTPELRAAKEQAGIADCPAAPAEGATAAEVPTGNTFDKYGSSNPVVKRLMGGFHCAGQARGRGREVLQWFGHGKEHQTNTHTGGK